MNSFNIFHDVQLKNYNNVMSSLQKACDQTSNLVDYMYNYKKPQNFNNNINNIKYKNVNNNNINKYNNKRRNQSVISRIGKNIINNNNSVKLKKKNSEYYKNKKVNKYDNLKNKIFGIKNKNNYYEEKNTEPYNYNNEYENNLIGQIENLFHPSANKNYEIGNIKEIMPDNYIDIYSLMGKEFQLLDNQISRNYKKKY